MRRIPLYPLIDYWESPGIQEWTRWFGRDAPMVVEIGFGRGETLVQRACDHPDWNIVGIEIAWASIQRALRRIHHAGISNIRIVYANADWALYYLWPAESVHTVWSLFPDPWPKARHIAHRLFSRRFFLRVNRVLVPGGQVHCVTDAESFVRWVLDQYPETGFRITHRTYRNTVQFGTKYEQKWLRAGRTFHWLTFTKTRTLPYPEPPWPENMRTYRWTGTFQPDDLTWPEKVVDSDVVLVFKETLWDAHRHVYMIKVIIREDTFLQKVWLELRNIGTIWRLAPSDGCKFVPTYGLQRALDVAAEVISRISTLHASSSKVQCTDEI